MIMANRSYRSFAYRNNELGLESPARSAIKVVHIVQHLRPGGIETLALDFLKVGFHPETAVISLEGNEDDAVRHWPRLAACRDRIMFLSKKPGLRPGLVGRLAQTLSRLGPDVVHTHHIGPLFYGGMAARLAAVPRLVHTEHDAWHLEDARAAKLAKRLFGLLRPTIVADAAQVAENVYKAVGVRPAVILNGIDTERFSPGDGARAREFLGLPEKAIIVGTAGRLTPVKNHRMALQAFAKLPAEFDGRPLVMAIAGDGEERESLAALAETHNLRGRVHLLGHCDDMARFYNALDVYFLSSSREGLPLGLLEAQSCGLRAVATDVGGCREALCSTTGRLVPNGDQDAFAAALLVLSRLPRTQTPRQFVLSNGDARSMHRAYEALYR